MFAEFRNISKQPYFLWAFSFLALVLFSGCAAESVSRTSFNRALLGQENIRRVAVLPFENSLEDPMAGSHISQLFEMELLQTDLYQITDWGVVDRTFKEKVFRKSPEIDPMILGHLRDQMGIEGIILGVVSQYSRANFGFTARLVSTKSGLVLWSVSQTAGRVVRPLSQVASEAVRAAVKDLQANLR